MTIPDSAATGYYTLNYALAMIAGMLVCLLVAGIGSKVLERRGQGHYLPAVVLGSFVAATALTMVVLLTHHAPDKMIYAYGNSRGVQR